MHTLIAYLKRKKLRFRYRENAPDHSISRLYNCNDDREVLQQINQFPVLAGASLFLTCTRSGAHIEIISGLGVIVVQFV